MGTMLTYAQDQITGTVVDETGEGVIGATVMEKGTSNGTVTDFEGNFTVKVAPGTMLVISYVGYENVEMPAKNGMKVTIHENANELSEVVVTGYQVQRKADLTGAVGVMDMKQAKSEGSNNIVNSLQGRIPGVNVITDPAPGGGSSSIQIRGVSNFNGNNAPLYVIDGVATTENLNSINPADIETMQVLKDASSASIYGSRAANGVVIITTKSGKGGKLSVNVGYTASAQFVAKKIDMLDANQFGTMYYQAMANNNQSGYNPLYTYDSAGNAYLNQYVAGHEGEAGYELHDTNWQDKMYKTAWTHNLNASVSNSSEKGSMMFSGNYISQNGVAKYSKYKRYTIRLNSTYNLSKYVTVGENLMVARWNNNIGGFGGDAGGSHDDIWSVNPILGSGTGTPYNRSEHAIFTGIAQENYNGWAQKTIALLGPGTHEDHNCFWIPADCGQNYGDNGDVNTVPNFEQANTAELLGGWGQVTDYCVGGIIEFKPTDTYKGTVLINGFAAYEWHQDTPANGQPKNVYQNNIEKLTTNAINYLK